MGRATNTDTALETQARHLSPTRVLVAGDIHMDTQAVEYLARIAKQNGCQVILQVGDLGYWAHEEEGKKFLRKATRLLKSAGVCLYWIDGNHESFALLLSLPADEDGFVPISENIYYIPRGHRWQWGGVSFLGLGGAFSIDKQWRLDHERKRGKPQTAWWPQELITDEDVAKAVEGGPVDVLVCHDAPAGVNLQGLVDIDYKSDIETMTNRRRLDEVVKATTPKQIFHGHYHLRHDRSFYLPFQMAVPCVGLHMNGSGERSWYLLDLEGFAAEQAAKTEVS